MTKWIKAICGMMLLVFAAVQFNDPDPMLWVFFYGVGAFFCFSSISYYTRFSNMAMYIYIVICLFFSWYNWPTEWMGFDQPAIPNVYVEQARESCGLLISASLVALCRLMPRY